MFDIGFSEIFIIAIVALLVLGPERLPRAARFTGLWVRRARAQWYSVKSELESELADDELKKSLSRTRDELRDIRDDLQNQGREIHDDLQRESDGIEQAIKSSAPASSSAATTEQAPDAPDQDDRTGGDADTTANPDTEDDTVTGVFDLRPPPADAEDTGADAPADAGPGTPAPSSDDDTGNDDPRTPGALS